jgi:hypothetical protein
VSGKWKEVLLTGTKKIQARVGSKKENPVLQKLIKE